MPSTSAKVGRDRRSVTAFSTAGPSWPSGRVARRSRRADPCDRARSERFGSSGQDLKLVSPEPETHLSKRQAAFDEAAQAPGVPRRHEVAWPVLLGQRKGILPRRQGV
jgi:hypothetical protein